MATATPQRLTAILYREDEVCLEECPQPALAPRRLTTFEVNVA
ncbi:MAG: hypothetical protein WBN80_13675 [Prochlorococcaceae cyanobacterium]